MCYELLSFRLRVSCDGRNVDWFIIVGQGVESQSG
jgi:hypothetical protein